MIRCLSFSIILACFLIYTTASAFEYKSILKGDIEQAKTIFTKRNLVRTGIFCVIFLSSMGLDKEIDKAVDKHRGNALDNVADTVNVFGNVSFTFPVAIGLHLMGLAIKDNKLAEASFTAFESLLIAGGLCHVGKTIFGRARPRIANSPFHFRPFRGYKRNWRSLPCGHATMASALVTPYAVYYHQPWLYLLPIFTSFARVYKGEHWFSDTILGMGIGFSTSYLLSKWHLNRHNKIFIGFCKKGVCLNIRF